LVLLLLIPLYLVLLFPMLQLKFFQGLLVIVLLTASSTAAFRGRRARALLRFMDSFQLCFALLPNQLDIADDEPTSLPPNKDIFYDAICYTRPAA
jgi:hypothetical protein